MSSSGGTNIRYTLFGESHGEAIGITIDGLPSGISLDLERVNVSLMRRQGHAVFNTPRQETPAYSIVSGFFQGKTTGTPLTILFQNTDKREKDYEHVKMHPRPGHADYVADLAYSGAQDYRGGGHFSGRLTAPLVAFGSIAQQCIEKQLPQYTVASQIIDFAGIRAETYYGIREQLVRKQFYRASGEILDIQHILRAYEIDDLESGYEKVLARLHSHYQSIPQDFPVTPEEKREAMVEAAVLGRRNKDSFGGKIETVIMSPPVAIGRPFFDSVESKISALLYSIGSVKACGFGAGSAFAEMSGSECKDEIIRVGKKGVHTLYNFNGGINGGISNGEDIVFETVLKPIASIAQEQYTYNRATQHVQPLKIQGRHDSTIINRVIPVIEAVVHIALLDLMGG